jgi:hypothetical protein
MFCPLQPPSGHFMYDYGMHNTTGACPAKLIVLMLLFVGCCSCCYGHYQQWQRFSVLASLLTANVTKFGTYLLIFTFMVPCIIIHKLNKTQQDAPLFLKS